MTLGTYRTRCLLVTVLVVLVRAVPTAGMPQPADTVLHVDGSNPTASDFGPGTPARPLRTIQEGVQRAVMFKRDGIATRVLVHPGVYRESIDLTTDTNVRRGEHDPEDPNNPTAMIFEAVDPGSVVVSGSDVWTGWERAGLLDEAYQHDWPYDWDPGESLKDRREMVFVDGELLEPVDDRSLLGVGLGVLEDTGTMFVDEDDSKLYVTPPAGVRLPEARVEVGVRSVLWDQFGEDNVTIRGFEFRHAVTAWEGGQATVRILESDHVRLENCRLAWNNWQGLFVGDSRDFTIRDSELNHNGGQGWSTWRVRDFVAEDSETSFNNWRGALTGHLGWNVGNKILQARDVVLRRHRAEKNRSRGLWLDFNVTEAVLDEVVVTDNQLDGVWVEATRGPVTIQNSLIRGSQRSGLRATYAENVTVRNTRFEENAVGGDVLQNDSQIILDGGGRREVEAFETGEIYFPELRDWTLIGNTFVGGEFNHRYAEGPTLIDTDLEEEDWRLFVRTLHSDENVWHHPDRTAVFGLPSQVDLTLEEWRRETDQDANSIWASERPSVSEQGAGTAPEIRWVSPGDTTVPVGGGAVEFEASARDAEGDLEKVAFHRNGNRFAVDSTRPFTAEWEPSEIGVFELHAEAVDRTNRRSRSSYVYLTVDDTTARESGTSGDRSGNRTPRIRWAEPPDTVIESKTDLALRMRAEAWDGDGGLRVIRFYVDDEVTGVDSTRPFEVERRFSSPGTYHLYGEAEDVDGATVESSSVRLDLVTEMVDEFRLRDNFPNPFNARTTVRLDLPWRSDVRMEVYDVLGRLVRTRTVEAMPPGRARRITFSAQALTSGVYFYRVVADGRDPPAADVGRMTLVR